MHSIWTDQEQAAAFEREGFVVIDLLTQEQVAALQSIYKEEVFDPGTTFYSSSFIADKSRKQHISRRLEAVIDDAIAQHFSCYKKLGAVFLIKPPGPQSIMPIHQDWTVVDESCFDAMTVWIALQDTTEDNGCIKVLPRSHRLSRALRAPTLPNPLQEILPDAERMMQALPMKAGQAFIFSHALLHASFPNLSTQDRVAVAYGVLHQDAELLYYFREKAEHPLELLRVPDDFFLNYPLPGERPQGSQWVAMVEDYQETPISPEHFKHYYGMKEAKPRLWKRLKHWLHG